MSWSTFLHIKSKFSTNQLLTLLIASFVNFFCSATVSIQAPFYPAEAEKKGATATEYGLVFGSYELVAFIASPLFGKIVHKTGAKLMLGIGIMVSAISITLFGFLDIIESRFQFIFWSFILRIFESLGSLSASVASFSLVSSLFPDNLASVMSTLETFFGLGCILGPTIGGLLFQIGGFPLPFFFVGLLCGVLSILILVYVPDVRIVGQPESKTGELFQIIKIPSVAVVVLCSATLAASRNLIVAILEPYLRIFDLSVMSVAMTFIITGLTYAVAAPIVGRLMDKWVQPKYSLLSALILNITSFAILGPLPFLPIPRTVTVCRIALFLQGLTAACGIPASYADSVKSAVKAGFSADFSTYGLISGIWISSICFGAFVGPSVGGYLYDTVGFQNTTIYVVVTNMIVFFILSANVVLRKSDATRKEIAESEELEPLL